MRSKKIKVQIPLSECRNIYRMHKWSYYNNCTSQSYKEWMISRIERLTIEALDKRIAELEAALMEIADDEQQNWSVDGYGAWTWVGDDDPATIARRALEGGSDG